MAMDRFDYLEPAQGQVVEGLEDHERIFALEQGQYKPLRTLAGERGLSSIYRLELSDSQRKMVADGADVLVEVLHFGGPMAPTRVMLFNQRGVGEDEKDPMARWFAAQTKAPYSVE